MSEYVLELKGITKIFPGVKALNNVQFQLKPGEVHALMGENGAGKSTFIKVITGVHKAEEGEMFLNGQKVDFKGPKDAQAAGIAAVYQHPTSYPHLTVAENIFMGHEIIKNRMIQWKAMNTEANKLLKQLDADFDATAEMGTLSVAQQQMVEIAKAMSTNARIIILDEPTAALTRSESEKLYTLVDKLKADGVSIIFISHRFEDMYRLASRVTVFRDSQYIGTYDVDGITNADLIKAMVGREIKNLFNGFILTKFQELPPMIVTLATQIIFRGISEIVLGSGGSISASNTDGFRAISGKVGDVPYILFLVVILSVIFAVILGKSTFGRRVYAIGTNRLTAYYSGVHVQKIRFIIYTIMGTVSGLCALFLVSSSYGANTTTGNGFEMDAIAMAVFGGISSTGGKGNIAGGFISAFIIVCLRVGLGQRNVNAQVILLIIGVLLIAAVALPNIIGNAKKALSMKKN